MQFQSIKPDSYHFDQYFNSKWMQDTQGSSKQFKLTFLPDIAANKTVKDLKFQQIQPNPHLNATQS